MKKARKPEHMYSEDSKPTDPGARKEAAPAEAEPLKVEIAATEATPEKSADPVAVKAPEKYRVKATKKFSLLGQTVIWHVGDIVEESSYGPLGIKRALEAGVELEKL